MFKYSAQPQSLSKILRDTLLLYKNSLLKIFLGTFLLLAVYNLGTTGNYLDILSPTLSVAALVLGMVASLCMTAGIFYGMHNIALQNKVTFSTFLAGIRQYFFPSVGIVLANIITALLYTLAAAVIVGIIIAIGYGIFMFLLNDSLKINLISQFYNFKFSIFCVLFICLILLYLPIIYVNMFTQALLITDNKRNFKNILACFRITWGNYWRIGISASVISLIAILLFIGIILLVVNIMIIGKSDISSIFLQAYASSSPDFTASTPAGQIANLFISLISIICTTLIWPLFAAYTLVMLNDLKLRKSHLINTNESSISK